mgnify:CR=1 FL=1|tara:strand:+ start:548 stop:1078 length:531 start_codon:yes stop_codon:yes gene_type:complete
MENLLNQINQNNEKLLKSVNGTTRRLVTEISKNDFKNSKELKEMFSYYCSSVLARKIKNCENWGRIFTEKVDPETNFGRPLNFYYEFVCKDGLKLINKIETTSSIHCGGFQRVDLLPMDKFIQVDGKTQIEKSNDFVMSFNKFKFQDMDKPARISKSKEGRKFITDNLKMQFVTDL